MRIIAYVDGFNLYYRALNGNPAVKWLNLEKFAQWYIDANDVLAGVKYYTAPVSGHRDPDAPRRQQAYFRALKTIPSVETFYGSFMKKEICRPLVNEIRLEHPPCPDGQFVLVKSTEEKGSDVNLASHLLRDAFTGALDAAIVVSADTDLIEPIRIVTRELGKRVDLVNPAINRPAPRYLREVASSVHQVNLADLAQCQLPSAINTQKGRVITRPTSWV
jgi:uncharacterized LabA/DUF88 family protein